MVLAAEFGIVFLHHRACAVTEHHAALLRQWHPGVPFVALTTAEGIAGALGPEQLPDFAAARARYMGDDWPYRSSSDVLLAAWWRMWRAQGGARARRWVVVEWDVWCGGTVREFFREVWDFPVVLPGVRWPRKEQEWAWWAHVPRLPAAWRAFAVGTVPFTPMMLSEAALDALAEGLTLERSGDVIYELRLPTLLNAAGFAPVANPRSGWQVTWQEHPRTVRLEAGLVHPVKWLAPGANYARRPWVAEDIAVVFLTCPREPSYFAQTLASFYASDARSRDLREVAVAVDAPDLSCVEWLRNHAAVRFVERPPEESERVKDFHLHRKACAAYWRAMGLARPGARAVLVCEDDVIFRDGWLGMLLECLNEMQGADVHEFILAAYSPHDHEHAHLRRGRCYSSYVAGSFFGTQAVFYPAGEVEPVREIIWKHGVLSPDAPYDLLMKRRALSQQHLYTTRHSLVQHAGVRTTGLGGHHQSPSFWRAWPEKAQASGDLSKPWMTEAEIALADRWLSKCSRVFEYGSGGSTVRWASGREWYFTEHDAGYYARVVVELDRRGILCRGFLVPPSVPIAAHYKGFYPPGYLDAWEAYSQTPEQAGGRFDAVLVDGRARLACGRLAARKLLTPGGVILWHDFGADGRERYDGILSECELVEKADNLAVLRPLPPEPVDFCIVMTIVESPEKVAWALRHLRAVYPTVPTVLISDGVEEPRYAEIATQYQADYILGEKLKVLEKGGQWWQRAFEAGLAFGTRHILKVDPDTRFNRPILHWPDADCFGTISGKGQNWEHIQGGVQGFSRSAAETMANSGRCLCPSYCAVETWAWGEKEREEMKRDNYLSTDRVLMRLLREHGLRWENWPEVMSLWERAPENAEHYAISHAHK